MNKIIKNGFDVSEGNHHILVLKLREDDVHKLLYKGINTSLVQDHPKVTPRRPSSIHVC